MSDRQAAAATRIDRLAEGWGPSHWGLASELVDTWGSRLQTRTRVKHVGDNTVHFEADLGNLRLRGMDRVPCLLLGGDGGSTSDAQSLWRQMESPGRLLFVLTLSRPAWERAQEVFPLSRCLILSPEQVHTLLDSSEACQLLREILWCQVPRRRLIPYNILRPADGTTFFGRRHELDRLRDEDDVTFAIAGPGRIGKTSVVRQYHREMRGQDGRATRIFYVSFYECADPSPEGVARFLASRIEPSSQHARLTAPGLVAALRYLRNKHGGPLDLLLDEVDEVCRSEAFHYLGEAARQHLCRVVLCGRGELLKSVQGQRSPLAGRIELIRLEPLDAGSARKLLMEPLTALGFTVHEPDRFADQVLALTGRLPHLLQFFGKKLAALGIEQETSLLSLDHIETLKVDFDMAQFFTQALREIRDTTTRQVAVLLLRISNGAVSIPSLVAAASREGLNLDPQRAVEICNDLVIHNVLTWVKGSYHIASGALVHFARQLGFLGEDLPSVAREAGTDRRGSEYWL